MERIVIFEENDLKNLFGFLDRVQVNPNGNQGIKEAQIYVQILTILNSSQSLSDFEEQIIKNYENQKENKESKEKK